MHQPVSSTLAPQRWFLILPHWLLISLIIRVVELSGLLFLRSVPGQVLLGIFGGGLIAILQWTVIRQLISNWSRSWIRVTWLGFLLSLFLSRMAFAPLERFLDLQPGLTEYDRIVLLFYLFWLVEALVLGSLQAFLLQRWSQFGWVWVFVLSFSLALEWALIFPTSALASLFHSPSIFGFMLIGLALMLTSTLTGLGLLRLLNPAARRSSLASE